MPSDVSLFDSKCLNGGKKWVNILPRGGGRSAHPAGRGLGVPLLHGQQRGAFREQCAGVPGTDQRRQVSEDWNFF